MSLTKLICRLKFTIPFLMVISFSTKLYCQTYENLVFEGGGIRGISYAGALEELEKAGSLKDLKRVAGTSVGAVQATLVALNYRPEEMSQIISELNLKHFNDGRFIFIGGFNRLLNRYGWYRGDALLHWIENLIEEKTGNEDITFRELHELTKSHGFKDLYITGTNLSKQKAEVFSFENYPDMKIKDAVRISVSIPLYFKAVLMDPSGNVHYKGRQKSIDDVFVDGGILLNYPIHIFDDPKYFPPSEGTVNPKTLGLRLDSDEQIECDLSNQGIAPSQITNFKGYVGAFYNIIIENLNRQNLQKEDWDRTISISTKGVGPKIKKMSAKSKNTLIDSGREGAKRFLKA
jgi:NTE family protein